MVEYEKRDALWVPRGTGVGVAYAFFDSNASIKQIEELAVNEAKRIVARDGEGKLEYLLTEVNEIKEAQHPEVYDFIQNNEIYATYPTECREQMGNAKPIKMTNLKYALMVARHGRTDLDSANYVGNVMDDIYTNYNRGKPFNVAVVYKNPKDGYLDFKPKD